MDALEKEPLVTTDKTTIFYGGTYDPSLIAGVNYFRMGTVDDGYYSRGFMVDDEPVKRGNVFLRLYRYFYPETI